MQSISNTQRNTGCFLRHRNLSYRFLMEPEICFANFSVHAQEPHDSLTNSNIPPIYDGWFLTENFIENGAGNVIII